MAYQPAAWNAQAKALFVAGRCREAVQHCLTALESGDAPSADAYYQPALYLLEIGDLERATRLLAEGIAAWPNHPQLRLALGIALDRAGKSGAALAQLQTYTELGGREAQAFDTMVASVLRGGDMTPALLNGTLALSRKDKKAMATGVAPPLRYRRGVGRNKKILSFTLFGTDPRYLRGALQNILLAPTIYPGWTCRFYVDHMVDATLLEALSDEGAELCHDPQEDGDLRRLLSRRFLVADDPDVDLFQIRDCDSVISPREAAAVDAWIASDLPFHAMRDWWTHTDLMLAGMWGGRAGALPDLGQRLAAALRDNADGPNWDQQFLARHVWPSVRDSILVHDRLYQAQATRPFPGAIPTGTTHVGQNEYVADPFGQAAQLARFARQIPALQLL